MKLRDIKGQVGTKFVDRATGTQAMTLCLCAGMIRQGDAIGGEHKTAIVVLSRCSVNQAHPGHTFYWDDETIIELVAE